MKLNRLFEETRKQTILLVNDLPIIIEYEIGDVRKGHNWQQRMKCPYGHLLYVTSIDKEKLDCFVHPRFMNTDKIFVVHQIKEDGIYDEDKIMIGFNTKDEAYYYWSIHYPHADKIFGGISEFTIDSFKKIFNIMKMYDPVDCIIVDFKNKQSFQKMGLIENIVTQDHYIDKHREVLSTPISKEQMRLIDLQLDKIYKPLNINVEFTKHFLDRVNDPRNNQPITVKEILKLFIRIFNKYGKYLHDMTDEFQAVMRDISTAINIPFVLVWNRSRNRLELIAKTIMRKSNFSTPNQVLQVESKSYFKYNIKERRQ